MNSEQKSKPQHWEESMRVAQKFVSAVIPGCVLYRAEEAVVLLGLGRSQLYELIRSGRGALSLPPHTSNGLAAAFAPGLS
jgi:hypothetical protein